ncbi:spore cortex biosynthesis protein YabQ [Paenibacillus assamensis]|uniref:spore cortex biosynthesis protein YabQ n=1 Tax=Paenibacillus assamensis TaxID=311244 RepID=UPI00041A74CB|nr:spore cortex biosynthesis protein YabQ [Paenibacillus assamensis]
MSLSLHSQWITMLFMFVSGLTLGIAYDASRVVAGQLRIPRWILPVMDILYWIAATWFVFHMLIKGNQGEFRFYVILGLAVGAWAYVVLFSRVTVIVVNWLVQTIKVIVRMVQKLLYITVFLPLKGVVFFIYYIFRILVKTATFLGKVVLKCIQPLWWLLQWLLRPLVEPVWRRLGMTERLIRLKQYGGRRVRAASRLCRRATTWCAKCWNQLRNWPNRNNQA